MSQARIPLTIRFSDSRRHQPSSLISMPVASLPDLKLVCAPRSSSSFNSKIYIHYCPPGPNSGRGTRPPVLPVIYATAYMHWKLHGRCWIHSWSIVQTKMQKKLYQGTFKLNFGLWPNWTRPDPPFPVNFLTRPNQTRPDPRVGSRVVQLCALKGRTQSRIVKQYKVTTSIMSLRSRPYLFYIFQIITF